MRLDWKLIRRRHKLHSYAQNVGLDQKIIQSDVVNLYTLVPSNDHLNVERS